MNYRINGGKQLSGEVTTNTSKNAAVALLCASLLNKGTTTLKRMPRIEELNRLIEVLRSIGVSVDWPEDGDMTITMPDELKLEHIDRGAAQKTRSIAMFIGPLAHHFDEFNLPAPGGCKLGGRTMMPHIQALEKLGIEIREAKEGMYHITAHKRCAAEAVMFEASVTGTENALMAAACMPGESIIKFAAADYMVQDLCVFLQTLGVDIEGIGTSTLVVHGKPNIRVEAVGYPSEDPIESMFWISLAATTRSELTIKHCPIDMLELELLTLESMGLQYERTNPAVSDNGHTKLIDLHLHPSTLVAPPEKIAARPFPGINTDNLPFFVPIATQAQGRTLIHDWMYEERAEYYTLFNKLGADVILADPHRAFITGATPLTATDMDAPPALRPATSLVIGMLAAEGESLLRNIYPIGRGYEHLHRRLKSIGAEIEALE